MQKCLWDCDLIFRIQLATFKQLALAFAKIYLLRIQPAIPCMPGMTGKYQEGSFGPYRKAILQQGLQPARAQRIEAAKGARQLIAEQQHVRRCGNPLQDRPLRRGDLQIEGLVCWLMTGDTASQLCRQALFRVQVHRTGPVGSPYPLGQAYTLATV